ncbi:hypothetical protein STEG23_004720 [Scotinomys teguina]
MNTTVTLTLHGTDEHNCDAMALMNTTVMLCLTLHGTDEHNCDVMHCAYPHITRHTDEHNCDAMQCSVFATVQFSYIKTQWLYYRKLKL